MGKSCTHLENLKPSSKVEESTLHLQAAQCRALLPSRAGDHHTVGIQANCALSINLALSDEDAQCSPRPNKPDYLSAKYY